MRLMPDNTCTTFNQVPRGYEQLYTVHARVGESWTAVAQCIMSNSRQSTYELFCRRLTELGASIGLHWRAGITLTMDFEQAEVWHAIEYLHM